jgi:hypothetical protein
MTLSLRRCAPAVVLLLVLSACRAGTGSSPSASESVPTPTVEPSATAEPTAPASADASSEPTASASSGELGAFDVAPNAEADALFLDRDDCENLADGYRVQFPDAWYTNTAIGDVEPCQWFSPSFYEVYDPSEVPSEIAITIEYLESDYGSFEEAISRDFGIVGRTQEAVRVEYRGAAGEGGQMPPEWRSYVYLVQLGPTSEEGPNLLIQASTDMGGDYELNKAVMDRIIATMELLGTIQ